MRIRFCLAVTAIVLLVGYPHDRQLRAEPAATPTPGPAPGAVAPDAYNTELATVICPSPELPPPKPDDTAIEPATYTVCDLGYPADDHMRKGVTPSGKLLDLDDRVTICELDEAMRLKFTYKDSRERAFDAAAFIVDFKARQLKALDFFEHPKPHKSPQKQLVKITRNNKNYEPPKHDGERGCDKEKNHIIRIQFCSFEPAPGDPSYKWRCPGEGRGKSGAHQGDIHAQN